MWPINADQIGTPEQVRSVIEKVRANTVPVLYCESTVNGNAMEQVAAETGAHFAGTLYVDSLTAASGEARGYKAQREDQSGYPGNGLSRVEEFVESAEAEFPTTSRRPWNVRNESCSSMVVQ